MSNWTHVSGIIYVDMNPWDEKNFNKVFGEPFDSFIWDTEEYQKEIVAHPERFMPTDDNGFPIDIKYSVTEDGPIMQRGVFTLIADLNGYDDTQEIMDYFVRICNNLGNISIRQATITAHNEYLDKVQVGTIVTYELFNDKIAITTFEKGVHTKTEYFEISEYSQVGLHRGGN